MSIPEYESDSVFLMPLLIIIFSDLNLFFFERKRP